VTQSHGSLEDSQAAESRMKDGTGIDINFGLP